MTKSILAFTGLLGTLFLYQNCSANKQFSQSEMAKLVPFCREMDSAEVAPVLKWDWNSQLSSSPDSQWPTSNQVMSSPMVADLNGDGRPEVVFSTFSVTSKDHYSDSSGSSYRRNGVLRIVDGRTGKNLKSVGVQSHAPDGSYSPLLIDLDGDGKVEILYLKYITYNSSSVAQPRVLVALNHDGSLRWTHSLGVFFSTSSHGLTASDANNDGIVDILAGPALITEGTNKKPKELWRLSNSTSQNETVFSALDPTRPRNGYLITNTGVYFNGVEKYSFAKTASGLAVGDIYPERYGLEIVTTSSSYLAVYSGLTGDVIKSIDLSSYNDLKCNDGAVGGGPPSVGDFDGDSSTLEIAVSTGRHLTIFDKNLVPKFKFVTQDCSSKVTGLTSYDLNGDLKAEVLYADEEYFRIYEIQNGALREVHKIVNPSGTLYEYPVVADIEGNFTAELILASNNYAVGSFYKDAHELKDAAEALATTGVRAFQSAGDQGWMPTRPLWNQYSFHPDQFNDDAQFVPFASLDPKIFRRNNQGAGVELKCKH